MRARRYLFSRLLPCLLWMGLIYFCSSQTGDQVGNWINTLVRPILPTITVDAGLVRFSVQKLGHFLEYAVLALLAWRAIEPLQRRAVGAAAWLLAVLYAISDEWHQMFVPGRGPSWRDVGIDALGALCGLLIWQALRLLQRRNTLRSNSGL